LARGRVERIGQSGAFDAYVAFIADAVDVAE
jgi:hypothetical protein